MRAHQRESAAATVLTARVAEPDGYGRIVRRDGEIAAIVEHKDASAGERRIDEINSGVYAFDLEPLFGALKEIGASNAQGEYYLPDLVRIFRARNLRVRTATVDDPREILGSTAGGAGRRGGDHQQAAKRRAHGGGGHDSRIR